MKVAGKRFQNIINEVFETTKGHEFESPAPEAVEYSRDSIWKKEGKYKEWTVKIYDQDYQYITICHSQIYSTRVSQGDHKVNASNRDWTPTNLRRFAYFLTLAAEILERVKALEEA